MSINPFETTKNYSDMLDKIGILNFFSGVIIIYFLGKHIPEIKTFSDSVSWNIELFGSNFKFFNLAIPFIVSILSRIIKLHDRISDIFGIRIRYDVNNILKPMAVDLNYQNTHLEKHLRKNRKVLMRKCFYSYASTQEDKCKIDYHSVIMTIDQLSWYWALLEIIFITIIAMFISLCYTIIILAIAFLLTAITLFVISLIVKFFCLKYTRIEVELILEDANRRKEIIQNLNAV